MAWRTAHSCWSDIEKLWEDVEAIIGQIDRKMDIAQGAVKRVDPQGLTGMWRERNG